MIRALSNEPVNGRWLVTGLVGRGSTATVFRGFDLVAERLVAIKMFSAKDRRGRPASCAGSGHGSSRPGRDARREFLDQARMRHPNLVETFELAEARSGPLPRGATFFTMELLEQSCLWTGPAGRDGPEWLAQRALDLLSALECLHAHGLVHNDVKPSNVLLRRDLGGWGRTKLGDFGLVSRGPRCRSGSRTLSGTLHYLAPEVIAGERVDARSDLYSLGVMLFEAATGALPFNDSDPAAALEWHMGGRPADQLASARLSPVLSKVVARLLQERPGDRFQSAREAWEEIAEAFPGAGDRRAGWSPPESGPLIGRRAEMERLASWLTGAARTGGRLRIVGPAGSGLSRFAREAAVLGCAEGWIVHDWRCSPGDPPFAPLRRPLRDLILGSQTGAAAGRPPTDEQILALLGGPALWDAPGALLEKAKEPLARSITAFLAGRDPGRPLLLVLDDLECVDEGTRLVVQALSNAPGGDCPRILLLTTEHETAKEGRVLPGEGRDESAASSGAPPAREPRGAGVSRPSSGAGSPQPVTHPSACRRARRLGAIHAACAAQASETRGFFEQLRLGPIDRAHARRLVASLPCMDRPPDPREAEGLIRMAEALPGRLARLACRTAGRQRLLFPPLCGPLASA